MPRVTPTELLALFPQQGSDTKVDHYIDDAHILVEETLGTSSLSEDRKRIIERYLAAHLFILGVQEGGIFEEKIGESTEKRGSTFTLGQGLRLTRWGQMALGLDTTGGLAQIGGGAKKNAQFRVI